MPAETLVVPQGLDFTDYAIHVWKPDGTLRHVIRREHARHVRSDDEIETIESNWERSIARWVREPRFEIEPDWNPVAHDPAAGLARGGLGGHDDRHRGGRLLVGLQLLNEVAPGAQRIS